MPTFGVIKHLDVIEHITASFFASGIGFSSDAFALQQLEKAFCHGVIVTVTASAHAADQVVGLEETLPVRAAELAALVGVDHHFLLGLASPNRHQ